MIGCRCGVEQNHTHPKIITAVRASGVGVVIAALMTIASKPTNDKQLLLNGLIHLWVPECIDAFFYLPTHYVVLITTYNNTNKTTSSQSLTYYV